MEFKQLDDKYIDECVQLAIGEYNKAQRSLVGLLEHDYREEINDYIIHLFQYNRGVVALEHNQVIGFLAFAHVCGNKDKKGVSSPIWGYGIKEGYDRGKIISLLYQHSAQSIYKEGITKFNVTLYANDEEVMRSYFFNNFGALCTEAIRFAHTPIDDFNDTGLTYKELSKEEILKKQSELLKLWQCLVAHLQKSPTFYPGEEFTDTLYIDHIFDTQTRVFVVIDQESIVGMVDVSKDSNSFITTDENTLNIGDLYVRPEYRGEHVASGLLSYVNEKVRYEGRKRLWVEHGTTNPTAQRFWGKHFTHFTYTLTRELDEGIL